MGATVMPNAKHSFKAPAFQLYAKEFLQDEAVIAMDLAAVGAYIILLCHQWNEGSVPANLDLLARICRTTADEFEPIWPQVAVKFSPAAHACDRLLNRKLEIVRDEKMRFSEKQSRSGEKGAEKRWKDKPREPMGIDGLSHPDHTPTPMGSEWGNDSSGSGSGSGTEIHTPSTPSEEGAVKVCRASPESRKQPVRLAETIESLIITTAQRIHARHPKLRRCGIGEVKTKLRAILRQFPASEREATLRAIEANHAEMCALESWQKDGGQFAKGLDNWLAPTKGRWQEGCTGPETMQDVPRLVI
jgi:uncharacterized protein YdaU (DUF1376 family)